MNNHEIKQFIKEYAYLFWWVKESEKENLNLDAIVEAVLNYGDIPCIKKLFKIIGIHQVSDIFYQTIKKERINYYPEVVNFFKLYFERNV